MRSRPWPDAKSPVRMSFAWFDCTPEPRKSTASTASCAARSSRMCGMVSRVSAAARSIGLPRLQRGGSSASIAARRSSGKERSDSSERASASAVRTPQPPAVVSTATFGPRGSGCVAKVAAASNASSTVVARLTPACRHMPAKIRSSLASAPVCDAAACCLRRWLPRAPTRVVARSRRAVRLRRVRGRRARLRGTRDPRRWRGRPRRTPDTRRLRPPPRSPPTPHG